MSFVALDVCHLFVISLSLFLLPPDVNFFIWVSKTIPGFLLLAVPCLRREVLRATDDGLLP